ncbi:RrF2 family transcriptional regulator [Mucisphaera calidilacus]|uniref:HTH-type transcriptional regulator CymR n=1 Tax=Mucisphaera calidilacus TaxID=2527982 RepID=A0A518C1A0_9BACT|nr:Rrf2 family transcriptional regulator [Mucisphaera calidilacus]QDU73007.1 HTH-type transcriptional regulator CymR [Mucisphaera calidilacus]
MLSLTKKADYALVALTHLAGNHDEHTPPTSARHIADAYQLPLALLMNILKDLAAADIVASTRGARGGYHLQRQPDAITLLDVFTALEGPIHLVQCCDDADERNKSCRHHGSCPIENPMQRLDRRMRAFFHSVTLDDLVTDKPDPIPTTPLASNNGKTPTLNVLNREKQP